jgi:hypothetical protein
MRSEFVCSERPGRVAGGERRLAVAVHIGATQLHVRLRILNTVFGLGLRVEMARLASEFASRAT